MLIQKLKNIVVCGVIALNSITLFSGCDTSREPVNEAITVNTATEETLSDEELDKMVENIPEIVFVMSYQTDDENIFGCYVMNTGIIKLFDFRGIEQNEIYDVRDVYDRLDEAVCERLEPRSGMHYELLLITEDNLNHLSQDEMIKYYKRLLLINGNAEYIEWGYTLDGEKGYYKFYGIKENNQGITECILLRGYGTDSEYKHSNPDARDMYADFIKILPKLDGITLS